MMGGRGSSSGASGGLTNQTPPKKYFSNNRRVSYKDYELSVDEYDLVSQAFDKTTGERMSIMKWNSKIGQFVEHEGVSLKSLKRGLREKRFIILPT